MLLRALLLCCLLFLLLQWGLPGPALVSVPSWGTGAGGSVPTPVSSIPSHHYIYLDEDSPLEVLAGPGRCLDIYRDWISLYCWAPFHAAIATTSNGSRCHWDHVGSIYSDLSNCTELLAEVLGCPWPSAVLDAFFVQLHANYFSGCSGVGGSGGDSVEGLPRGSHGAEGLPRAVAAALAAALSCLVLPAAALALRGARARRG